MVQSTLRGSLEGAGKEIAGAKNKLMMAQVDAGIQKALSEHLHNIIPFSLLSDDGTGGRGGAEGLI